METGQLNEKAAPVRDQPTLRAIATRFGQWRQQGLPAAVRKAEPAGCNTPDSRISHDGDRNSYRQPAPKLVDHRKAP